jgi:hypothetical protein
VKRVAFVVALAVAGAVIACGSASLENAGGGYDAGGPNDGGTGSDGAGLDGNGGDSGVAATAVTFVYTGTDWASVRLCWAPGGTWSLNPKAFPPSNMPMPASNYAGIPQGGASMLADADQLTTTAAGTFDLTVFDATIVQLREQQNNKVLLCSELACDGPSSKCAGKNNYKTVAGVPALTPGFPYVLAITGTQSPLDIQALRLGMANTFSGVLEVQAAQVASALGTATVTFGPSQAGDGGAEAGFQANLQTLGDVEPPAPVAVTYKQDEAAFASQGFSVDTTAADGGAVHLWMSLAQSLSLVAPTQDPSHYFTQRTPFVVAVVGDPSAPPWPGSDAGAYDGTGLHLLVLPTTSVGSSP